VKRKIIIKRPKKELWMWRVAFVAITSFFIFNKMSDKKQEITEDCIVRTKVYGEIFYDDNVLANINSLADNDKIKGVLLQVDSPGGTITGSEALYKAFKELKTKKPLVVSVQNFAASGGYMVAMAADKIFAYETSALGSIGVIAESFEVTDLAEKIGVKFLNFKSSPLKGVPSIFEKNSDEANKSLQSFIDEMQSIFKDMVHESRPAIDKDKLDLICNGMAYSGRQAVNNGLIDGIGTEQAAMDALKEKVKTDLPVNDYDLGMGQVSNGGFFSHFRNILKATLQFIQ
jgi:protease-4